MFAGAIFIEVDFSENLFLDVRVGVGGDYLKRRISEV